MLKSKKIALLLVVTMLMSMLTVFPAMTVNAANPILISNVEPAIPATVGTEITLSDYSVQLNDGTVLAPGEITWYNGSSAVTKFTPSAAGVTTLTAKKASDNSVSKSIYVVAKLAIDTEYVLFSTDFNSASDIDGWNKIVKTDGVYTISDGKLTISGLTTANPRIYLPSWLADFGDYRIDVTGTQTDATDTSRWFSIIYRAQNSGTTGTPYYHMCVRNNATAEATATTGGVELCYYNNTWTYIKSSSYTEAISASKQYTFSVLAKGSTIQYQINGDMVIHAEDVPTISGNEATRRGGIGLQANSSKFIVDSIKISLQQTVPVKPVPPAPKIINTRQPDSNTLNHIANIGIVQSKAEYDSYINTQANAPSTLILYANGSNLMTENGTALGTVEDLMSHAVDLPYIPAFYVKDTATVDKIVAAAKGVNLRDLLFISNDYNIVKYARDKYSLARGAVDFSSMSGYTLSDEQLLEIRGIVRKATSLIAILPENLATQSIISELQAMEITVWVMDKSLNGDTEAAKLITSGATGIITDKFAQIETALQTLVEPNTLTKTPQIIGHRGNPTNAPENSISSYLTAISNGADIVETDIQFTKDRQIIAMHDGTIDRTTTGTGSVGSLTLAEIKQAHLWNDSTVFQAKYPDERVPTWEEMLQALKSTNARIFCEIKSGDQEIVQPAVDLVKKYGMENRVSFIVSMQLSLSSSERLCLP
jgi:glycerophosphoryl diester phosphodiesterase